MSTSANPEFIRSMFDRISIRYDLLNTLLSFGTHWLWKKELVRIGARGLTTPNAQILDCATGTADIAELWLDKLGSSAKITATDFSEGMLSVARKRHQGRAIQFALADVQKLPFSAGLFDRATISFGIRNVENPKLALSDLARVVKPGGKVLILEFGQPKIFGFAQAYRFYSKHILPWVGGLISGDTSAYRYLENSSSHFPCGQDFLDIAKSTHAFSEVTAKSLTGGIAWIYELTTSSQNGKV